MSLKRFNLKTRPRRNREELLQSITRDRALLNAYFQDLTAREESKSQSITQKEPQTKSQSAAQKETSLNKASKMQQRDSYDLFFESACISIKSLPPKLAAEAKSRISQIITEFELRAISEEEEKQHQQQQQQQLVKTMRVSESEDASSGIVYEFQPYT
ncbi:protein suppressor of variegation 3-7 [Drosophila innubila]|uniref:protein suppressor of variegation 3-7 n=1 Tax=Drosophila innubila TaxID=198719 RepID=UPI00148B73B7|nr:protein suppressor of variegation 3-7 [Drosophila innubila]